jgi:hypothetical protein
VRDIKKQLGLEFLKRKSRGGPSSAGSSNAPALPPFLQDALLSYGRPLLEAIGAAAPAPARLHDIVEQIQIPIDVALRVSDYLQEQGYLTVVRRDLKGNHELQLTDEGRRALR